MYEYKCEIVKASVSFGGGVFDTNEVEAVVNKHAMNGWEFFHSSISNRESGRSVAIILFFRKTSQYK